MRLLRRLVREPLLHFLAIGVLVFALYGGRARPPEAPASAVITVRQAQVDRLAEQFETAWRRAPTEDDLAALVEDWVREEVYYREALALGLDRDDAVIRRRLRQKMEFLSEGSAAAAPDEGALEAHYAAHPDRFSAPPRITFRQVALARAEEAEMVRAALADGADLHAVGRNTLLPEVMEAAGEAAVDATFGAGFFTRVAALPQGRWAGPVPSAYGPHLVEVVAFQPGRVPPFDAVREAVEQDWRRAEAEAAREAQYEALRARYRVVMPGPGE